MEACGKSFCATKKELDCIRIEFDRTVMGIIFGLCILLLSKLAMEVNEINLNR